MRKLPVTAALFLLCLAMSGFGGGPDVRTKNATVEHVVTDAAKIVLIVSGQCEVFLSDAAMPAEQGNARFVVTDMRHCVVTIMRNDQPGSGYDDWQTHCKNAESLIGQSAWMDLQGTATIERSVVAAVHADTSRFGPAKALEDVGQQ